MTDAPNLNPEQQAVVEHVSGPLRVGAVAGSGKTTALVERVVYLVRKKLVPVNRILMISFSKVAAQQMKRRIDKRLPGYDAGRCARTFHSIGLNIFKAEGDPHDEKAVDTSGLLYTKAITKAYKGMHLEPEQAVAKAFAGQVKNNLIGTTETLRRLGKLDPRMVAIADQLTLALPDLDSAQVIEAFFATERIREKTGVEYNGLPVTFVTFDDMIYQAAMLLKKNDIRARWAKRWSHVLQDECQDENEAQAAIAEALCREHRNYMVVGDPAQSVYGFRGSRPEKMLAFEHDWPGAETIVMHRNYRSGIEVVNLANRIMGEMPASTVITDDMGVAADMVSERQTHSHVTYHVFDNLKAEAEGIGENVVLHHRSGVRWDEQAVLMRMNRMTRAVEMSFVRRKIPYRLVSGSSFFMMKETRTVLGSLLILAGRATPQALEAALGPVKYAGRAFAKKVVEAAPDHGDWLPTIKSVAATGPGAALTWASTLAALRKTEGTPGNLASALILKLGIKEWLTRNVEDAEDSKATENLAEIVAFASDYATLDAMLDAVDEIERHRTANARKRNTVIVSTVHKAKGAEWGVVYLIQVAAGLFPIGRADLPEERRLFYVACTRAKDELWISMSGDEEDEDEESRFITEVGLEATEEYEPRRVIKDPEPVGSQMELV